MIKQLVLFRSVFKQQIRRLSDSLNSKVSYVLIPPLLQRCDHWLLLNRPLVWSSRIHMLTWISLLATIGLCMLGSIPAISLNFISLIRPLLFGLVTLETLVLFIWILGSRTIEREYGQTSPWRVYSEIGLFTLCAACIFLPSFCLMEALKINVASRFDEQQMTRSIADVDAMISDILIQLKTERPEIAKANPASSSECSQVLYYAKVLESVDPTFFNRLIISSRPLIAYSRGSNFASADILTDVAQLQSYCLRLDTVRSTRDFAFSRASISDNMFYGFHLAMLLSGWFLLNFRYFPYQIFPSFGTMLTIVIGIAGSAYGLELLISFMSNQFPQIDRERLVDILAVSALLTTGVIARIIFSINDQQLGNRKN